MTEENPSRRRGPKAQPDHRAMTFRLPNELHAEFKAAAERNRRTVTAELQIAMESHLQRCAAEESSDAA